MCGNAHSCVRSGPLTHCYSVALSAFPGDAGCLVANHRSALSDPGPWSTGSDWPSGLLIIIIIIHGCGPCKTDQTCFLHACALSAW